MSHPCQRFDSPGDKSLNNSRRFLKVIPHEPHQSKNQSHRSRDPRKKGKLKPNPRVQGQRAYKSGSKSFPNLKMAATPLIISSVTCPHQGNRDSPIPGKCKKPFPLQYQKQASDSYFCAKVTMGLPAGPLRGHLLTDKAPTYTWQVSCSCTQQHLTRLFMSPCCEILCP